MTVTLDGRCMANKSDAHDHLARQLALPEYYGKNLDALFDALTSLPQSLTIVLENPQALDAYGLRIVKTIEDAAASGTGLVFYKKDC